ncbi:MAG TPA: alpha/beta hydrolase [Acidimicrobiales bacterium]|nr:alpha/beta hydrolase [Acidimicrobiales bacterium]
MAFPPGLHVVQYPFPGDTPLDPDAPLVVLVHGTLDRANSFRRTIMRLPDMRVVAYDRRGYQSSRSEDAPVDVPGHIDDLLGVVRAAVGDGKPATVVGHSLGGVVTMGAALRAPELFASIAAYEPPVPWLPDEEPGDGPPVPSWTPLTDDADAMVENFFRRQAGDSTWEGLADAARADRLADGPALMTELRSLRGGAMFDVTQLSVPALFGVGGDRSDARHRAAHDWLLEHVPGAEGLVIDAAGHGAHLTHPDAFALFVRRAVELGAPARGAG